MAKLLLIMFSSLLLIACSTASGRVEYWEADIERAIPVGSSKQQVEKYLSQSGLEFNYIGQSRTFVALERDVENYVFVTYSVGINLVLDESDELKSIKVFKSGDGP